MRRYVARVNKQQRLRNVAEGFLAGLVECGYEGPWRWAHHQWECSFYRAWNGWGPHAGPGFPRFQIGGSADGRTSQAREILWQLKRTSPFHNYDQTPLTMTPRGMSPHEYIEVWVEGASPTGWVELAAAFLAEMARWEKSSSRWDT